MLDHSQRKQAETMLESLENSVMLHVYGSEKEKTEARRLWEFAGEIVACSDRITREMQWMENGRSNMEILGQTGRGIHYSSIPEGGELEPFLKTLQFISGQPLDIDRNRLLPIKQMGIPCRLDVYVMPECPFCPRSVELCNQVAMASDLVQSWIHDAVWSMEEAEKLGVRSTPAVVIDGAVRWVGQMSLDNLLGVLSPSEESWATTLKSQINAGSVEETMAMVLRRPESAAALAAILAEPEVSLRMGVLRVIEEMGDGYPEVTLSLAGPLCRLLKNDNPQIRGDAAYGLGLLGDKNTVKALNDCLSDPDEDVRDTVEEALEMIQEK